MAILKSNEHESQLNELTSLLNVQGVDQGKISLIIQGLRDNYNEVDTTIAENAKTIETTNQLNQSLRDGNMYLLSQLGTQNKSMQTRDKETLKTKDTTPNQSQEDVKSLDDIALELMK